MATLIKADWMHCQYLNIGTNDRQFWCSIKNEFCPADNEICRGSTNHYVFVDEVEAKVSK